MRSSRRKRNQYVVDLRHHVDDLRKRRKDLEVEHSLLEQLTSLWERLCKEVETEIQEGVKQQLGFNSMMLTPSPTSTPTPTFVTLSPAATPLLSPASNPDEPHHREQLLQAQPKSTPVIVMPRNERYPNTRGKRRQEETVKVHRSKRRLVVDHEDDVDVDVDADADLQTSLVDPCLLLDDEVVPGRVPSQTMTAIQLIKNDASVLDCRHTIH